MLAIPAINLQKFAASLPEKIRAKVTTADPSPKK